MRSVRAALVPPQSHRNDQKRGPRDSKSTASEPLALVLALIVATAGLRVASADRRLELAWAGPDTHFTVHKFVNSSEFLGHNTEFRSGKKVSLIRRGHTIELVVVDRRVNEGS